jgi:hypothetical protein
MPRPWTPLSARADRGCGASYWLTWGEPRFAGWRPVSRFRTVRLAARGLSTFCETREHAFVVSRDLHVVLHIPNPRAPRSPACWTVPAWVRFALAMLLASEGDPRGGQSPKHRIQTTLAPQSPSESS